MGIGPSCWRKAWRLWRFVPMGSISTALLAGAGMRVPCWPGWGPPDACSSWIGTRRRWPSRAPWRTRTRAWWSSRPPSPRRRRWRGVRVCWAPSMVSCWTSASPRPSWTRPGAASVSPPRAPWTCAWTTAPARRPPSGWRGPRRRRSPRFCMNLARNVSAAASPAPWSPPGPRPPS